MKTLSLSPVVAMLLAAGLMLLVGLGLDVNGTRLPGGAGTYGVITLLVVSGVGRWASTRARVQPNR